MSSLVDIDPAIVWSRLHQEKSSFQMAQPPPQRIYAPSQSMALMSNGVYDVERVFICDLLYGPQQPAGFTHPWHALKLRVSANVPYLAILYFSSAKMLRLEAYPLSEFMPRLKKYFFENEAMKRLFMRTLCVGSENALLISLLRCDSTLSIAEQLEGGMFVELTQFGVVAATPGEM